MGDLTLSVPALPDTIVQYVTRPVDGVRLAYRHSQGSGPTLVFLPGYKSDMQGGKALALAAWASEHDIAMLRLDYSGCGESEGAFDDGTLIIWRDDVLAVIDQAVVGPVILIGSSMGGWLMLLVAEALGARVKAIIGIAAAPDFTDWDFDQADRETIAAMGRVERPSDYGYDPMVITQAFWQSGQDNLRLTNSIAIDCPVRLIHGQCDPDVPWQTSLRLAEKMRSSDVQIMLLKDGDHRLSRDQDIALLIDTVKKLTC